MVEIQFLLVHQITDVEFVVAGVEFHVQQARGVVGAFQKGAQAQEPERLVHQHGAQHHAACQVRAIFHPLEETAGVILQDVGLQQGLRLDPGLVVGFPDFGGELATHSAGILARGLDAGDDGGRIVGIGGHELDDVPGPDIVMLTTVGRQQLADGQQAFPALLGLGGRDRQHAGLAVHIQHAGGVFGALDIAGHPQQVIGGA